MPLSPEPLDRFALPVPAAFRLGPMLRTHGWVQLAPWRWKEEEGVLRRRERLGRSRGEIAIRQEQPDRIEVAWHGVTGEPPRRDDLARLVAHCLSWDWRPDAFITLAAQLDPAVHELLRQGAGRLLRGAFFYEDFVKTVCTINTNWPSTLRMVEAIVARVGRGVFPRPEAVLRFGAARLERECRLGFRARRLIAATRQMLRDGGLDRSGAGDPARLSYDYLLSLSGIGPYAAAHCRVLLHDFSRLPIDSVVTAHLKTVSRPGVEDQGDPFGAWGDYRFLAYRLSRLAQKTGVVLTQSPAARKNGEREGIIRSG